MECSFVFGLGEELTFSKDQKIGSKINAKTGDNHDVLIIIKAAKNKPCKILERLFQVLESQQAFFLQIFCKISQKNSDCSDCMLHGVSQYLQSIQENLQD